MGKRFTKEEKERFSIEAKKMMAEGIPAKEIKKRLGVSEPTLKKVLLGNRYGSLQPFYPNDIKLNSSQQRSLRKYKKRVNLPAPILTDVVHLDSGPKNDRVIIAIGNTQAVITALRAVMHTGGDNA